MNQKSAKMLRKYARQTGAEVKGLKKDWMAKPAAARAKDRKAMVKELND